MIAHDLPRIDGAELARVLQAADPAALLVPPRILRRVIKQHRRLATLGLQVPHHKSYTIDQAALLRIADPDELEIEPGRVLPATVILLSRPDASRLAAQSTGEVLVKYWRRLFHARVHIALEERLKERLVSEAGIRQRVGRIGQTAFNEIRTVLLQEKFLLPPRDERSTYVEFTAVYLELRHFAGHLLPHYFPNLSNLEEVDALLAEDVDAASLFAATRLAGAPDPREVAAQTSDDEALPRPRTLPPAERAPLPEAARERRLHRAARVAAVGNVVRAAILRYQAMGTPAAAAADLDELARRLQYALELGEGDTVRWRQALPALLPEAAHGFWSVEARLLYDLQKACLARERTIYRFNLLGWLLSLGRQPLKQPLPGQQEVLVLKHLRKAARRLGAVEVSDAERERLNTLLQAAIDHGEARLRHCFRAPVAAALDQVGLKPGNVPEEVARDLIVEELLDRIVQRGNITLGDLRDALSRNQLKLEDLSGPTEFLRGDTLLRLDRALASTLAGVYHRGEIYLRWLQRFSSLGFGTRPGRFVTRYLVMPFGGAFILLAAVQELLHIGRVVVNWFQGTQPLKPTPEVVASFVLEGTSPWVGPLSTGATVTPFVHEHGQHLPSLWAVGVLGMFLLLVLQVPPFRQLVLLGLQTGWVVARTVLIDLPAWVLRQPPVRAVLDSRPVVFCRRHLLLPLALAALVGGGSLLVGLDETSTAVLGADVFIVAAVLCNSRIGRNVVEALTDWLVQAWRHLSIDLIPGLFRLILDFFQKLLGLVQRLLYTVDEWLRFRSGQSWPTMIAKGIGATIWSVITYVVRFAINLLIEPQINPIKHFPVVTVSHKLVWSLAIILAPTVAEVMGWDRAYALAVLSTFAWMIPGIFGFMAWELKENWKLYRANRQENLRPVMIGHHGETMVRLLRVGFHSGTVPKLHAKLRRAERRGRVATAHQVHDDLHHVQDAVRHFAERELAGLLYRSRSWGGLPLGVGDVALASNRIRVELSCPRLPGESLLLSFEEQQGWLLARVARSGWLGGLTDDQRRALAAALTGLYKLAAVSLVHEQIRAPLPPSCDAYELTGEQLVVWPDPNYETEVVYDLQDGPRLDPKLTVGVPSVAMPRLDRQRLIFDEEPLTWERWVEVWEQDRAGLDPPEPLLPGARVLPA